MKMKKKILSLAVLTALGAGSAQAVNLSTDGTGEVLLFPYFTVQNGEETILSIVNTKNEVKAVKIRFLDAMGSREVLDFNLYLSPYDVWTAKVMDDGANGAKIVTGDKSCTVPAIPAGGVSFRTVEFDEGNLPNDSTRTREGYFEMIEMGVATADAVWDGNGNNINDAIHDGSVGGTPDNCSGLVANWAPGGTWKTVNANQGVEQPTGGLFGAAAVINVSTGSEYNVPPAVFAAFSDAEQHTDPGSLLPSLASAQPAQSVVMVNDGNNDAARVYVDTWNLAGSIGAVSALMMTQRLMNEYSLNPAVDASTSWVVTFPTKSIHHTSSFSGGVNGHPGPFVVDLPGGCNPVVGTYWDREEAHPVGNVDFSPLPPGESFELCYEANVVNFGGSNAVGAINTVKDLQLATGYTKGWAAFGFTDPDMAMQGDNQGHTYSGLPAIGFRVTKLSNGNVGAAGAYYAVGVEHKYDRVVSGIPDFDTSITSGM
jgi:hypothetical protein